MEVIEEEEEVQSTVPEGAQPSQLQPGETMLVEEEEGPCTTEKEREVIPKVEARIWQALGDGACL